MNSRKRHAPEPLSPTRAAKHPRTTLQNQLESGGLGSRWAGLGKELVNLTLETMKRIVPNVNETRLHPEKMHFGPTFTNPATTSTTQCHARSTSQSESSQSDGIVTDNENDTTSSAEGTSPPRTPTPTPAQTKRVPLPSPPPSDSSVPRFSPRKPTSSQKTVMHTPTINEENTPGPSTTGLERRTESMSPIRTRDTTSDNLVPGLTNLKLARTLSEVGFKWPKNYTPHPQVDEALARTPLQPPKPHKQRPIKNREHIFSKVHKAKVMQDRINVRVELLKRLYETKRSQGYAGSLVELEGWVSYAKKLEGIGGLQPSLGQSKEPSGDFATDFLRRALHRAQRTLKAPIAKPYTPNLDQLNIRIRGKDSEIDKKIRPSRPALPDKLPPQDEARAAALLKQRGIVSKFDREQVTDQDITRLRPGQWLNDEIINFYGAMILARSEACKENPAANQKGAGRKPPLNVHYFSTFFWTKLTRDGYEKGRLAKWTKKLDIFSKDAILIPVNHNNAHWTAASINFKDKRIESFDSMGMAKDVVFTHLRAYVDAEHRNKKKKPFDFTGWTNYSPDDITPQQENGYDCGVFTCQFLEHLSRGEEDFVFTQKDMPYMRKRMIWEIGNAKLRDDY